MKRDEKILSENYMNTTCTSSDHKKKHHLRRHLEFWSYAMFVKVPDHAREPLYSNSAVIAWWSQSTGGKNGVFMCTLLLKKGNKFLNILLLRVFFADYCQ